MSKGIAVMTRWQALLGTVALVLLALLAMLALDQVRHEAPAPPIAFADAVGTHFSPVSVSIAKGLSDTITIHTEAVDAGVDGVQFNIQHSSNFEVSDPKCVGIFSAGSPTGPSAVDGGTLIGCFLLSGNVSATTGNSMTFRLKRIAPDVPTETEVILFGLGGGFGTQYSDGGTPVGPGATGTLSVPPCCTLSGKTTLQYRASTLGPTGKMVLITANSTDGTVEKTTLAESDGSWQLELAAGKTYTVRAEAFSYLTAKTPQFVLNDDMTLPANQLKGGDINGDGFVNINDVTGVVSNFGKAAPQLYPTS